MSSKHIKSDITAYLTNTLPESRRREFEAHVSDCSACQQVLNKGKAKQARIRREALKEAAHEPRTNLFLHRIQRDAGVPPSSDGSWWVWIVVLVLVGGGGYGLWHTFLRSPLPVVPSSGPSGVATTNAKGTATSTETEQQDNATPAPSVSGPAAAPVAVPAVAGSTVSVDSTSGSTMTVQDVPEAPRFWSGADSHVVAVREVSIKGRASWRKLWSDLGLDDAAPRINFNGMMVVGVCAGSRPAGSQVVLADPLDEGDSILVTYHVTTPAPNAPIDPLAPPAPAAHPYALRTIPRGTKPVRFMEENAAPTATPS